MKSEQKKLSIILLAAILLLLMIAVLFNRFLDWHEHRQGIWFYDPVFTYFRAVDLSAYTFIILYTAIFIFILYHIKKPDKLILLALSYSFVLILRMLSLLILPFYADQDAIKLIDPFLNTFIYPGNYVTRDLFFSGHVATVVLLIIFTDAIYMKRYFAIICLLVSILVVIQKIHFSIDVIFAPFFALIAAQGAKKVYLRIKDRYNIS